MEPREASVPVFPKWPPVGRAPTGGSAPLAVYVAAGQPSAADGIPRAQSDDHAVRSPRGSNGRSSALADPSRLGARARRLSFSIGRRLRARAVLLAGYPSAATADAFRPPSNSACRGPERHRLALLLPLVGPLAPVELGVHEYARALAQVLRAAASRAP